MTDREAEAEAVPERTHRIIAAALRIGLGLAVVLAILAMVLGGSRLLAARPPELELHGRVDTALSSATLALIVLAATPALRVVLLGILWARQKDWRFVLVALAVAGVLAASAMIGRAG
jgi:uncharacterized membrane protein